MKRRITLILLILSLLIIQSNLFSQEIDVGLGLTLEYPQKIQYERNFGDINIYKFYLPITISNRIRILPEIAYWDLKHTYNKDTYKYSVFHYGIGLYYFIPFNSTSIYMGPRLAIVDVTNPSQYNSSNRITSKTDNTYGITFGAEHKIIKNFSIGFEVQYNYYEINPWTDYGNENVIEKRALETVFVFAFHI